MVTKAIAKKQWVLDGNRGIYYGLLSSMVRRENESHPQTASTAITAKASQNATLPN